MMTRNTQKSNRVGSNADLNAHEADKKELLELEAMQRYFFPFDSTSLENEPVIMPSLWKPAAATNNIPTSPVKLVTDESSGDLPIKRSNSMKEMRYSPSLVRRRPSQDVKTNQTALERGAISLTTKKPTAIHSPLSPLRQTLDPTTNNSPDQVPKSEAIKKDEEVKSVRMFEDNDPESFQKMVLE